MNPSSNFKTPNLERLAKEGIIFTDDHSSDTVCGQGEAGAYGEFMIETDWHLGRIMDWLDLINLSENTMIIFTSDNGPETTWEKRNVLYNHSSNANLREGKRSIDEGGHRVPFVIRWPNLIKSKSIHSGPVCQADLLATLAEMLNVNLLDNAGEDSQSLFKILKGSMNLYLFQ